MSSPYSNKPTEEWQDITSRLVSRHPLHADLVSFCLKTWQSILNGKINTYLNLTIKDMTLAPQSVSNLFHDILPEYIERQKDDWKKGTEAHEKDVVCLSNNTYSFEIKVSSSKQGIFGNRSYGQKVGSSKKSKDGYYLAINIDKLDRDEPEVRLIRFGWLDHSDWKSQKSPTGQQARLQKDVLLNKFVTLYERRDK